VAALLSLPGSAGSANAFANGASDLGDVRIEPPVVAVLSGGNIDPLLLSKLLRHGLAAAGRFLGIRCRVSDHPGSLAELLGYLAELGANVLEVSHERLGPSLRVDEVEVVLQVETRGPDHCGDVKSKLRAAGYSSVFS
jgi:threonine dehydratase